MVANSRRFVTRRRDVRRKAFRLAVIRSAAIGLPESALARQAITLWRECGMRGVTVNTATDNPIRRL